MKKRLAEHAVLFISVVKWIFLAAVVGVIVGLSTTVFLKVLDWSNNFSLAFPQYFLALPFALCLSTLLVKYLAPEAKGHGTEKVIEAVHKRSGRINGAVVPVKLAATVITLASGGSAGKEGPCAQIGAGLSSVFADLFKFEDKDRKKLVICGISAGFASVFGTPIAGAIFGVEVLFVGSILYDVLLPSFIAGIISYHVSASLGVAYFYHPIKFVPVFSEDFFIKVVLAGVFFGFCSALFIEVLKLAEKISGKMKTSEPVKALIAGLALVVLAILFSRRYLGLGLDTIESCLAGVTVVWYAFILKMIFTAITLGFGGSGGIVTPIFFIGTAAGSLFGRMLGLDPATFAAIGMVGLLAGAANTPIAASIMAIELFGPQVSGYATVACVISFLMTGYRSVYPSQVLAIHKSETIQAVEGTVMEDVKPVFKIREKSFIGFCKKILKKAAKRK